MPFFSIVSFEDIDGQGMGCRRKCTKMYVESFFINSEPNTCDTAAMYARNGGSCHMVYPQ